MGNTQAIILPRDQLSGVVDLRSLSYFGLPGRGVAAILANVLAFSWGFSGLLILNLENGVSPICLMQSFASVRDSSALPDGIKRKSGYYSRKTSWCASQNPKVSRSNPEDLQVAE